MPVVGLSTAFSPPRGSWIAVRIRQSARPERSDLSLRRRAYAAVRAEINFVDGDEAKRLVAEEGYMVLDIRDRRQHERTHIKSSTHVPLFIENEDNDKHQRLLLENEDNDNHNSKPHNENPKRQGHTPIHP